MKSLRNKDSVKFVFECGRYLCTSFSRFLTVSIFSKNTSDGKRIQSFWFRFSEYKSGDLCMALMATKVWNCRKQSGRRGTDASSALPPTAFPKGAVASVTSLGGFAGGLGGILFSAKLPGFVIGHSAAMCRCLRSWAACTRSRWWS